jgi:hypothetical protein
MRYSDVNYNNLQKNDKGGPTEIHHLLLQNSEYQMMLADAVYKHFFNDGVFTPESFEESFMLRKNEIENAIVLESARWGDYQKDISAGVTFTRNDHWIPEVNKVLEDYIPRRRDVVLSQLRANWPKLFPVYMPPLFTVEDQSSTAKKVELINPNTTEGDIYYTTDGSDPRGSGGVIHGLKYSQPIVISSSSIIKTRFLSKGNNEWTALALRTFLFDEIYGKDVVINEIMYHPENDFPEFIELLNTGENSINLDGFVFTSGINYKFLQGSIINPGEGLVLTNDTSLFRNKYGFKAFGQYYKRLDKKGEDLIFENCFNQLVDSVSYSDTVPWPVAVDGDGFSIEVINHGNDNSVSENWKLSGTKNGTPFESKHKQKLDAILYPNPFNDMIYIELGNQEFEYETFVVEIFNLFGGKVKTIETVIVNLKVQIPTNDLSQGMYLIKIKQKHKSAFAEQKFKALKL